MRKLSFGRWWGWAPFFVFLVIRECGGRARIQKVLSEGSNFVNVFFLLFFVCLLLFFLGRMKYHYKRTIIGPPAKRHLNGVSLAADDGPTMNAGLVALRF